MYGKVNVFRKTRSSTRNSDLYYKTTGVLTFRRRRNFKTFILFNTKLKYYFYASTSNSKSEISKTCIDFSESIYVMKYWIKNDELIIVPHLTILSNCVDKVEKIPYLNLRGSEFTITIQSLHKNYKLFMCILFTKARTYKHMKIMFVKRYISQRCFDNIAVGGTIMALNVIYMKHPWI